MRHAVSSRRPQMTTPSPPRQLDLRRFFTNGFLLCSYVWFNECFHNYLFIFTNQGEVYGTRFLVALRRTLSQLRAGVTKERKRAWRDSPARECIHVKERQQLDTSATWNQQDSDKAQVRQ
ncbi:hypothetical protein chiPu_0016651 [Chiloscyllium punctatum]|uniref:Uncharacterized protein n=1 Tax=Chiloscyllium punctatum TaxID=137246 RepID=A0A401T688_CHIPU|nr:hypothetical protein [Chiloscyllium punctatum]